MKAAGNTGAVDDVARRGGQAPLVAFVRGFVGVLLGAMFIFRAIVWLGIGFGSGPRHRRRRF
jgi:hypothetical protein